MRVKVQAGAELDFATPAEVEAIVRKALAAERGRPVISLELAGSGVCAAGAGGLGLVGLGSPAAGFEWEVRRLGVAFQDRFSASAGSAEVHVAGGAAIAALSPFTFRSVTSIPDDAELGDNQLIVKPGQTLALLARGAAGGETVFASATVIARRPLSGMEPNDERTTGRRY